LIARVWKGATLAENADAYAAYLRTQLPPDRGTLVLRRLRGGYAEFETILLFESTDDVRAFAGDEHEQAVFFDEDDRYLVERELVVRHYDVEVAIPSVR
jgi:hypothetical protein